MASATIQQAPPRYHRRPADGRCVLGQKEWHGLPARAPRTPALPRATPPASPSTSSPRGTGVPPVIRGRRALDAPPPINTVPSDRKPWAGRPRYRPYADDAEDNTISWTDLRFSNSLTVQHESMAPGGGIVRSRTIDPSDWSAADAYLHYDQAGSVAARTDAGGDLASRRFADAFGNAVAGASSVLWAAPEGGWGHAGGAVDADSGLLYAGGAWIDTRTGARASAGGGGCSATPLRGGAGPSPVHSVDAGPSIKLPGPGFTLEPVGPVGPMVNGQGPPPPLTAPPCVQEGCSGASGDNGAFSQLDLYCLAFVQCIGVPDSEQPTQMRLCRAYARRLFASDPTINNIGDFCEFWSRFF